MEATIKINGEEIPVEITGEELDRVLKMLEKPVKKTGYERVDLGDRYYYFDGWEVDDHSEDIEDADDDIYDGANYYSDKTVAINNARADQLLRKLRRFAVEHRQKELDWNNTNIYKYLIYYSIESHAIIVGISSLTKDFGQIYFDSAETARAAIKEFNDELVWYFTEYRDSL